MSLLNEFSVDSRTGHVDDVSARPLTGDSSSNSNSYTPEDNHNNNNNIDSSHTEDPTNLHSMWKLAYTSMVLVCMFAALASDKFGSDSIMMISLIALMAGQIVSVQEGIEGFSNEGLLTVIVLYVLSEGLSKTGALDWCMAKLLGNQKNHPKTIAAAQVRLILPIAVVSSFFYNTPIVVAMIPIVQRWSQNIGISPQQLLLPMSFATILGSTCSLLGASTNFVVAGLLNQRYPNDNSVDIGLFDLALYGVPVAMIGIAYMLLAAPFVLPGDLWSTRKDSGTPPLDILGQDVLLGARLTQWSPASGRTVQRSGLRDTGGIYLVSVHRAATGNIHRAVSNDFILDVGDILYFTGLVESFGNFCSEHGLEMVTADMDLAVDDLDGSDVPKIVYDGKVLVVPLEDGTSSDAGVSRESMLEADKMERLRCIHRMTDMIRNRHDGDDTVPNRSAASGYHLRSGEPAKMVVVIDNALVMIGIDAQDRRGLVLDVSKCLHRLNLQLRHSEAAVVNDRSISVWRCEAVSSNDDLPDTEEIWSVLGSLFSAEGGVEAVKMHGLRVIRARVTEQSRLVGKTAEQVQFRELYNAAIVAVQKNQQTVSTAHHQELSAVYFDAGDILVLQVGEQSPLLRRPPPSFYNPTPMKKPERSVFGLVNRVYSAGRNRSGEYSSDRAESTEIKEGGENLPGVSNHTENTDEENGSQEFSVDDDDRLVWNDLQVIFKEEGEHHQVNREFLTAMIVAPKSPLAGKTVAQIGINKLPHLYLVSIDRPVLDDENDNTNAKPERPIALSNPIIGDATADTGDDMSDGGESIMSVTVNPTFTSIEPDDPLQEGDVLWFSGPASAVGHLKKIPGLVSSVYDEVQEMNEKLHDRRLVQAVISRTGPLVGKTLKEVRFRTRYGAAVIAVHRDGNRVHELPGRIKLHAGDVLLLEAGPNFLRTIAESDRAFALLSEMEESAPPRLSVLIPALLLAAGMLAVSSAELCSVLISASTAVVFMVFLGVLSEKELRDIIQWDVYLTIAGAFGVGTALVNAGVSTAIANFVVRFGQTVGIGNAGLIGAVYIVTSLISNVVANNAAAALVFHVAMDVAEKTGTDRVLMAYALMFGASASFATPFGYTTNLLVYGPGGYKTKDFVLFGLPMQFVLWVASTAFLTIAAAEPWYLRFGASAAVLAAVVGARLTSGLWIPILFPRYQLLGNFPIQKTQPTTTTTTSTTSTAATATASNNGLR